MLIIMDISESLAWALLGLQPLAAVIGITFNVGTLQDALEDVRYTSSGVRSKNLAARLHAEWELIRLSVQVLLLFVGALVLSGSPDHIDQPMTVVFSRIALMLITVLMASKAFLWHRYQRLIGRLWAQERKRKRKRVTV